MQAAFTGITSIIIFIFIFQVIIQYQSSNTLLNPFPFVLVEASGRSCATCSQSPHSQQDCCMVLSMLSCQHTQKQPTCLTSPLTIAFNEREIGSISLMRVLQIARNCDAKTAKLGGPITAVASLGIVNPTSTCC